VTSAANASVSPSPAQGPPGTSLTISGSGFAGGETVTVSFNGTPVGTVGTDGSGNFAFTFAVPNLGSGSYAISARGSNSGATASNTFVIASPTPIPTPVFQPTSTPVPA